jgi:hypothetical protein
VLNARRRVFSGLFGSRSPHDIGQRTLALIQIRKRLRPILQRPFFHHAKSPNTPQCSASTFARKSAVVWDRRQQRDLSRQADGTTTDDQDAAFLQGPRPTAPSDLPQAAVLRHARAPMQPKHL